MSVRALKTRRKAITCPDVLLDSGAFTELNLHGGYQSTPAEHAATIRRLSVVMPITIAVAQDFMCEDFMLAKTGGTIADHQRWTIERYDELMACDPCAPVMPVIQGYAPATYAEHVAAYGDRLSPGQWVGVGSVCKRNGRPERIVEVLSAIKAVRPDLRLHGFGVKVTALKHSGIRDMLYSSDSMAWSQQARKEGRNPNDWREAEAFALKIAAAIGRPFQPWQMPLPL